jgi:hypothetical protein
MTKRCMIPFCYDLANCLNRERRSYRLFEMRQDTISTPLGQAEKAGLVLPE